MLEQKSEALGQSEGHRVDRSKKGWLFSEGSSERGSVIPGNGGVLAMPTSKEGMRQALEELGLEAGLKSEL